jgi:hypothetical protein
LDEKRSVKMLNNKPLAINQLTLANQSIRSDWAEIELYSDSVGRQDDLGAVETVLHDPQRRGKPGTGSGNWSLYGYQAASKCNTVFVQCSLGLHIIC